MTCQPASFQTAFLILCCSQTELSIHTEIMTELKDLVLPSLSDYYVKSGSQEEKCKDDTFYIQFIILHMYTDIPPNFFLNAAMTLPHLKSTP